MPPTRNDEAAAPFGCGVAAAGTRIPGGGVAGIDTLAAAGVAVGALTAG
jgi:hypothetical protein